MEDPGFLIIVVATFLVAGAVKGVIGLGLPSVSLGLLTVAADLPTAMALLLIPSFATNLWQGAVGGHAGVLTRKLWPFFLTAAAMILVGGLALTRVNLPLLSGLLGVLLAAYAALSLSGVRFHLKSSAHTGAGLAFGTVNGILTGMTGSFVVPGVLYLQMLGLERDQLIQAMGLLFTISTVVLAVSLQSNSLLTAELGLLSFAGLIPAAIGMYAGQRIRKSLSEAVFRKVFFLALLALGLYIILSAVL